MAAHAQVVTKISPLHTPRAVDVALHIPYTHLTPTPCQVVTKINRGEHRQAPLNVQAGGCWPFCIPFPLAAGQCSVQPPVRACSVPSQAIIGSVVGMPCSTRFRMSWLTTLLRAGHLGWPAGELLQAAVAAGAKGTAGARSGCAHRAWVRAGRHPAWPRPTATTRAHRRTLSMLVAAGCWPRLMSWASARLASLNSNQSCKSSHHKKTRKTTCPAVLVAAGCWPWLMNWEASSASCCASMRTTRHIHP